MTESHACESWHLLIQAETDGELAPADSARVSEHLEHCPACAELHKNLLALSTRLRAGATRHVASPALRHKLQSSLAAPRTEQPRARRALVPGLSFGAGFALAACLALVLWTPDTTTLADELVASHIRALQPGHLTDVASSDHHTVKPWFDGKLPFAPPVKELKDEGFPLLGGRLEYVGDHQAAALAYKAGPHVIDLFVWPSAGDAGETSGVREGYHFTRWQEGGMAIWAVSDVDARELAHFVEDWRAR